MKKLILVVLATLFLTAVFATSSVGLFSDIPEDHWAYEAVSNVVDAGVMNGYPDGSFKGDETVTRYELAQVLDRMLSYIDAADASLEELVFALSKKIAELSLSVSGSKQLNADLAKEVAELKAEFLALAEKVPSKEDIEDMVVDNSDFLYSMILKNKDEALDMNEELKGLIEANAEDDMDLYLFLEAAMDQIDSNIASMDEMKKDIELLAKAEDLETLQMIVNGLSNQMFKINRGLLTMEDVDSKLVAVYDELAKVESIEKEAEAAQKALLDEIQSNVKFNAKAIMNLNSNVVKPEELSSKLGFLNKKVELKAAYLEGMIEEAVEKDMIEELDQMLNIAFDQIDSNIVAMDKLDKELNAELDKKASAADVEILETIVNGLSSKMFSMNKTLAKKADIGYVDEQIATVNEGVAELKADLNKNTTWTNVAVVSSFVAVALAAIAIFVK
jgi:hypothetical protein